ncbi:MAG: sialate O-acetylesterase [Acidobacteria bacterium]|nr:sialate O-acetylesterase [Acidobacteriota bacterium]
MKITRFLLAFLSAAAALLAEVKLPALISDNMVLQQQMPVRIWGWAKPGETVVVTTNGQTAKARTNQQGDWEAWLRPMTAGGPFDMTIAGDNTLTVKNILVGEVWVASGQSNMQWALRSSTGAEQEIAASNYPQIRFFQVRTTVSERPDDDVKNGTGWKVANPDNTGPFSGVAWFFAKELHRMRGVPVGILQSAVGGTPAQAWTTHSTLANNSILHWYLDRWGKLEEAYPAAKERHEAALVKFKAAAAKARAEGKPAPRPPAAPAGAPGHSHTPSGLFNGMIAPLTNYAIRGAIWYQGESNAGETDAELYRYLFAEMITDWRREWGQGDFPFLWVQLASFAPPAGRNWPVLRDSQTQTLSLRNTGQALAIDAGESNDIHPKDKLTIGHRLALAARAVAYGERIVYSGPTLRTVAHEPGALRLWFDHPGSGLASRDNLPLTGFRVAGSDGRYFKAEARIEGDTIVVSSPLVPDPLEVRYAWENDPVANLTNREGLPATPFRTDSWKQ